MEKKQEMLRSRRVDVNTYVRRRRRRRGHAPQSQNEVVAVAEPAVQQRQEEAPVAEEQQWQEEAPVAEEQRRRQELSMAAMGRNWKWELQPVEMSYTRRRRRGGAPEEQQREEEAQREETPPPTRRRTPASSDKEAAADAVEQWEEEAPAAEVAEEQHQQETEEVEHFAAAVPIGDPVSVTGRPGRNHKKHYASFEYNGQTFNLEDTVMVTPEHASQKPYVAVIKDITETEGSLIVTGQWYYRPEEAEVGEGKFCKAHDTRELFYSFHIDNVPAESVMHSCVVHFIPENKQIPARKKHPGFIVQKVYGAAEKKLWNLKDNGYDDHRQKEIDMLVKRTIDRIGELPDLEPEDTPLPNNQTLQIKDVNQIEVTREPLTRKPENIERLETSESSELKNYGILARYKAITGIVYRDKWLDKLLESIPLAWSKEIVTRVHQVDLSSSNITDSDDNDKSYAVSDVVPIIVALERSAYEALGTDSDKYNHKLTQLWYNIKYSSKLRTRLMNKELDPPALLIMSPDELKAGWFKQEKTSEPEKQSQLQMTDARCPRCQDKKVEISDIIKARHRDRYQLECTSCGHTWFSSYDADSSQSAERPCTASVAGNTEAGDTAARVADPKKKQHVKSCSRLVRSDTKRSKFDAIPEDESV